MAFQVLLPLARTSSRGVPERMRTIVILLIQGEREHNAPHVFTSSAQVTSLHPELPQYVVLHHGHQGHNELSNSLHGNRSVDRPIYSSYQMLFIREYAAYVFTNIPAVCDDRADGPTTTKADGSNASHTDTSKRKLGAAIRHLILTLLLSLVSQEDAITMCTETSETWIDSKSGITS